MKYRLSKRGLSIAAVLSLLTIGATRVIASLTAEYTAGANIGLGIIFNFAVLVLAVSVIGLSIRILRR